MTKKIAVRHDCLIEYASAMAETSDSHVVVLHVANCMGAMGSGVALDISKAWPEVEETDKETVIGDLNKLGKFNRTLVKRDNFELTVLNIYAQYRYGPRQQNNFDIAAFDAALESIATYFHNQDVCFVFPAMGAGRGGGSWRQISDVIVGRLDDWPLYLIKKP